MNKKDVKMIEMAIRNTMPDTLSYSEKCQILERLAEEYRKKSRKEVYAASNFKGSDIDYTPILPKDANKG